MSGNGAFLGSSRAMARLIFICAALVLTITPASAAKRFAFVIGNGAYERVPALANPANDAEATRRALEETGFDVVRVTDGTLAQLRTNLETFAKKVEQSGPGATAAVFYAGHAVQFDGTNYLLPVDVKPESHTDIASGALSLTDILRRLDATGAATKVVILDACRDNPFAAGNMARGLALTLVDGGTGTIRSEAGLARVESKSGTFVAFSTSPGETAADGTGQNSPFTAAFLKLLHEPGLPVEQLFRRVRLAVHEATGGQQTPWETSSLTTDFAFREGTAQASSSTPPSPVAAPAIRPASATFRSLSPVEGYRTAIYWDQPDVYRLFLGAHPDDPRSLRIHRILAARLEEAAWAETVRAGDAESFAVFLRLHQNSSHEAEARRLVARAPSRHVARAAMSCPAPAPARRVRRTEPRLPLQTQPRRAARTPAALPVAVTSQPPRNQPQPPGFAPPPGIGVGIITGLPRGQPVFPPPPPPAVPLLPPPVTASPVTAPPVTPPPVITPPAVTFPVGSPSSSLLDRPPT